MDIEFRQLARADLPQLDAWLSEPHVARWWPREDTSFGALEAHYGPVLDGEDPSKLFIVAADGEPIGFCETYLHADNPDWDRTIRLENVAGIDYLIGRQDLCGHGVGTAVIRELCALVFELYPEIAGIASVPQAANPASRRVLEKNGFRLVDVREIESDDPGDSGLAAIYLLERPKESDG